MDRRAFLQYLVSVGSLTWANTALPGPWNYASLEKLFAINSKRCSEQTFPQGIASGDPLTHGITLWTRVNSGRRNAMPVAYEIAADHKFSRPLLRGVSLADAETDFTVKIQISDKNELDPFQTYYYRFICGGCASPIGRFKTLPAADANLSKIRFAFISCQDYTNGYYTALAHLAEEDIDFVVHLGDYIYETVADPSFQSGQVRPLRLPSGNMRAESLDDYRYLYKAYRSDANLQRLHQRFPFISVWDDHEFANDGYREFDTDTANEAANYDPQRRQHANQAWAEYMPAGPVFHPRRAPLQSLRIYRSFAFGNLLELVVTDERLYRDGPPCGLEQTERYLTPACPAIRDPRRTMLGVEQREWFVDTLARSGRTWKVWGNQVMAMQLKILQSYAALLLPQNPPSSDLYFTLDQWDGYQHERAEVLSRLRDAGVTDLIAVTGDIHTYMAGNLKVNFDDPLESPVGVEFICSSVTSANFGELATFGNGIPVPSAADTTAIVRASNPHIQYFNSFTHGYNLVELTPEYAYCTMKAVDTIKAPYSTIETLKRFRVMRGHTQIEDVTVLEPVIAAV